MLKLAALAALAGVAFMVFRFRQGLVSGEDAQAQVADGATLLDVRSKAEFGAGHLPGAMNVPVDELQGRTDDVGSRETPVVVYCKSGVRSDRAKRILEARGFTHVSNLGGMHRWPSS